MLCLGDSYTIGEAVLPQERFANLAIALLKEKGISFEAPHIIAQTGWTTDELAAAINNEGLNRKFDVVTLLIGVNNQYRNRTIENYKAELAQLVQTAIGFSKHGAKAVLILSIPDWSVTSFVAQDVQRRTAPQIQAQIEYFNTAKKQVAALYDITFIDITPISQMAKNERNLIAEDGLHPSGEMYLQWAELLCKEIEQLQKQQVLTA